MGTRWIRGGKMGVEDGVEEGGRRRGMMGQVEYRGEGKRGERGFDVRGLCVGG